MKRFLTLVLSIILFATAYSLFSYVPISKQEPNILYFGFFEIFVLVIIYGGSIYFIVGLPLSILIDKLIEKGDRKSTWANYFVGLGLYTLFGILVGASFLIILSQSIHHVDVAIFSIYGIIASNFYYHSSLLISKLNGKFSTIR